MFIKSSLIVVGNRLIMPTLLSAWLTIFYTI